MLDDIQAQLESEIGGCFHAQPKTYLGDAVYAFYDGATVILATNRGINLHWMALEPDMIKSLQEFYEKARLA